MYGCPINIHTYGIKYLSFVETVRWPELDLWMGSKYENLPINILYPKNNDVVDLSLSVYGVQWTYIYIHIVYFITFWAASFFFFLVYWPPSYCGMTYGPKMFERSNLWFDIGFQ
jgi:hypothetical protein